MISSSFWNTVNSACMCWGGGHRCASLPPGNSWQSVDAGELVNVDWQKEEKAVLMPVQLKVPPRSFNLRASFCCPDLSLQVEIPHRTSSMDLTPAPSQIVTPPCSLCPYLGRMNAALEHQSRHGSYCLRSIPYPIPIKIFLGACLCYRSGWAPAVPAWPGTTINN